MASARSDSGFAAFADKWLRDNPEQAVVLIFLPAAERRVAQAFGTLVHELESALFGAREPQAAAAKLSWWQHELVSAQDGSQPRHPVARELFEAAPARAAAVPWRALCDAAIGVLDTGAPASLADAFAALGAFYLPVAAADAILRGAEAPAGNAAAQLWCGSQLLRALAGVSASERAAWLPLDLLARHDLTRAALQQPGRRRAALAADFLRALAGRIEHALAAAPVAGASQRVRSRLDLRRARAAARSADPVRYLATARPARWRTLWLAWREAAAQAGNA